MSTQVPNAQPHAVAERDRVIIFDTTMRDGEQAPGASMSLEEKLELAKILEEMRVDVIEAGFPIASNGDFEAVRKVSEIVTESTVCGLARAGVKDIERAAEAIKPAKRGRIHTFLSTSPQHRDFILNMSQEEILELITKSVTHARNLCGDVEWSAQVVVAVGGQDHRVRARHVLDQVTEDVGVFGRIGIADRVGDVDGGGAGLDRRVHRTVAA